MNRRGEATRDPARHLGEARLLELDLTRPTGKGLSVRWVMVGLLFGLLVAPAAAATPTTTVITSN